MQKGIHETTEYLEIFLRNLLLNEKNELHNRDMHISGFLNTKKVDIGSTEVDIQDTKVDIESTLLVKHKKIYLLIIQQIMFVDYLRSSGMMKHIDSYDGH